jgi:hypothetical protein
MKSRRLSQWQAEIARDRRYCGTSHVIEKSEILLQKSLFAGAVFPVVVCRLRYSVCAICFRVIALVLFVLVPDCPALALIRL